MEKLKYIIAWVILGSFFCAAAVALSFVFWDTIVNHLDSAKKFFGTIGFIVALAWSCRTIFKNDKF